MARQIIYANDSDVTALDRLTGIDSLDRSTKNFTIEAIAQLFASTGLADVSKLAFFFNYNAGNSASLRGQAYYRFLGGNLDNTPAGINEIIFNRYDSAGKDFEPLAGSIRGSHIKLTAVGNAADTNYGLYEVLTNPTISGSTITVSVRHLASSGTLPNDEISISVLSSTATGTGVSVTDGEDPPVANATNHEGDLYIQIQEHETEVGQHQVNIWLYKNGVWVNEANLTGRQGEMGIQGFQGVSIVPGTASGDNTTVGQPTTFTVDLRNDDPNGPQNQTLQFTVPAGAKGDTGANLNGALLNFVEDGNTINITYDSNPVGNFPAPLDGVSITDISLTSTAGLVDTYTITYSSGDPDTFTVTNGTDGDTITVERNTADNGITVTSSGGTAQDVLDGADGDTVTVERNAADDGVTITSSGGTSQDILDGVVGDTITVERNTADDGITVTSSGGTSQDVLDGSDGDTIAVARNAANTGITVTSSGGDSQDVLDGAPGIQGSITFRYYRGVPFADPDPAPITIVVTAAGLINVIPDWDHDGVPATYDPATENLWVAEYIWNPADAGETELLHPFKETGPQGPGSGSSNVDGVVVNGTDLAVSESGTAVTTHVVPIAQGTTDNDTLASKGYVDEHTGTTGNVKLTPGANQMITQASGTVLDVRGSFDLEDNAGGKSFDFSGTSGDIHIEDNGDIKLYFDKSSGKVFYDDANTGTLSTATVNELATQGDISSHGTSNVDDVVIDAGRIKIDEAGNPIGTGIELATGTADNDKIATQGYVDDNESGDVNRTPAELKVAYESNANTNAFTDNEQSKLAGIEDNATADQTDAEIKTAYENNANTNAFTDDDESKLDGIQAGAQVNPTALSAFMNDEGFIDLSDVPVRNIDFQRAAVEDVQILSDGTLRMHLATRGLTGFTYGFLPVSAQTVGSLTSFDITLTNVSSGFTAVITEMEALTGFSFSTIPADGVQTVTVTPTSGLTAGTYTLRPTVESTETSTGVTADHTNIHVTFQVQAATVPPVQSDYFYFGFTNNAASPTSADDDIAVAQIADETAALDAGGFPAVSNVTREQFASGGIEVIGDTTANPFGSDDFVSFIAVPTTEVVTTGGVVTTPLFHDLTLNPMGEVFIFDYMNTVEIGTTDYTVFKQVIDSNARFRINF